MANQSDHQILRMRGYIDELFSTSLADIALYKQLQSATDLEMESNS